MYKKTSETSSSHLSKTHNLVQNKANKLIVKVKRLKHFKGELPEYKSAGASGFDIRACIEEDILLKPNERALIPYRFEL